MSDASFPDEERRIRLDKWLWHARVYKTRSLAQKMVAAGKIRLNSVKTLLPSHPVRPGDVLTITAERVVLIYEIRAAGKRRGPYSEARELYHDRTPVNSSGSVSELAVQVRTPRPDRRDRRKLALLRGKYISH
jgi:ribosome-associated heat shock protein Hsp15